MKEKIKLLILKTHSVYLGSFALLSALFLSLIIFLSSGLTDLNLMKSLLADIEYEFGLSVPSLLIWILPIAALIGVWKKSMWGDTLVLFALLPMMLFFENTSDYISTTLYVFAGILFYISSLLLAVSFVSKLLISQKEFGSAQVRRVRKIFGTEIMLLILASLPSVLTFDPDSLLGGLVLSSLAGLIVVPISIYLIRKVLRNMHDAPMEEQQRVRNMLWIQYLLMGVIFVVIIATSGEWFSLSMV